MDLVLHQFTNRAHPPVTEMVNIIGLILSIINHNGMPDYLDNIFSYQSAPGQGNIVPQPFTELIASYFSQVITLRIEEQIIN